MKVAENNILKFANVFCSQCGQELGPGNHGFSHCSDHVTKDHDSREAAYNAWRNARIAEFKDEYIQYGDLEDAINSVSNGTLMAKKLYLAIMAGDLEAAKKMATFIMDEAAQDNAEYRILTEEEMMEVKLGLY